MWEVGQPTPRCERLVSYISHDVDAILGIRADIHSTDGCSLDGIEYLSTRTLETCMNHRGSISPQATSGSPAQPLWQVPLPCLS